MICEHSALDNLSHFVERGRAGGALTPSEICCDSVKVSRLQSLTVKEVSHLLAGLRLLQASTAAGRTQGVKDLEHFLEVELMGESALDEFCQRLNLCGDVFVPVEPE